MQNDMLKDIDRKLLTGWVGKGQEYVGLWLDP